MRWTHWPRGNKRYKPAWASAPVSLETFPAIKPLGVVPVNCRKNAIKALSLEKPKCCATVLTLGKTCPQRCWCAACAWSAQVACSRCSARKLFDSLQDTLVRDRVRRAELLSEQ